MAETFNWTIGKKKLELPKLGNLPIGISRKLRHESETEQFFQLFEILFANEPEKLALFDTMTQEEVVKLMTAWQKESGVNLGESKES